MAFHDVDYDVYVVLGNPDSVPLWHWEVWRHFESAIDPLIRAARGKPALRSMQYLPGKKPETVRFGRLGWKETDHEKWVHRSPREREASRGRVFHDVELWAPSWNACEREGRPPDVFVSISNESAVHATPSFNSVVLLAVIADFARHQPQLTVQVLTVLRRLTLAKLVARSHRPWGKPWGSIGFRDAINDLYISGLFRPGPRHTDQTPTVELFSDSWEVVV
jgi:hypothetical protein